MLAIFWVFFASAATFTWADIPVEKDTPQLCLYCLNQMQASFDLMKKRNVTVLKATLDELQDASRQMCQKNMKEKKDISSCIFITFQMGKYLINKDITKLTPIASCKELNFCDFTKKDSPKK